MTGGQVKAQAALFRARLDASAIRNGTNPYAMPKQICTIGDLKPGQSGYTLPWAFSPDYPVFEREGGTASMPIGRDLAGRLWIGSEMMTKLVIAEHRGGR